MLIVTTVTLLVFYRKPDNFDIRSAFTCACIRIGTYNSSDMNEIERACNSKADEAMGSDPSLGGQGRTPS